MRATFKIFLHSAPNKAGLHPVIFRVTWLRSSKKYSLHRACTPDQWDASACRFRKSYPGWNKENDVLRTYEQRAADALRDFEREGLRFSFDTFEARVFQDRVKTGQVAWKWVLQCAEKMDSEGRLGNGAVYRQTSNAVKAYAPSAMLPEINEEWLRKFEAWMRKHRALTDGGISIHFRTLKTSCNKAIQDGQMPKKWKPFEDFSLRHLKKTKAKRAIPLEDIWRLRDADCYTEGERFALDLFMFSFYTRGMNLADIAELRPANVRDLRVVYERKKTHKVYSVPLHAKIGAILDRYKGSDYLFPVYKVGVHDTDLQRFNRLKKMMKAVNKTLRVLVDRVGLKSEGFTFYIGRHSYTTAHKMRGTSIEVIRELLGHSDYKTTEHYLSDFDHSVLDRADEGLF